MICNPQPGHACPERTWKAEQRVEETVVDNLIEPMENRKADQGRRDLYCQSKKRPDNHFDKLEISKRMLTSLRVMARRCGYFLFTSLQVGRYHEDTAEYSLRSRIPWRCNEKKPIE